MTAICLTAPQSRHTQWVSFIGGEGVVQSYIPDARNWIYVIEMTLGSDPTFGRAGAETTVMLNEADLRAA